MKKTLCAACGVALVVAGSAMAADENISFGAPPEFLMGINLSGAEFAGGVYPGVEDRNYCWPNEATLDYWQSIGVRLVRLPFKWERLQPTIMGDFAPDYRDKLLRSVRRLAERGMWVVPDLHNYAKYRNDKIGDEALPYEAFADVWRRLALLLKDEPNIWGYGLMNEPQFAGNGGVDWPKCAQVAIDAIRAVDAKTQIVVANDYAAWAATYQKDGTLADWAEKSMLISKPSVLRDPSDNLRFELHTYFDHDNSGLYKNTYAADAARGTRVSPQVGVKRIKPFVEWLKRHGAKGFVGEFGCPANPGKDDVRWLDALDNTMAFLRAERIPSTIWSAGQMWTPGLGYVAERRGWSTDLPDEIRRRDRPQTLIMQRHMDPPRITPEGERQLREYMESQRPRVAESVTADGFARVEAFDEYGSRKTPIFHLSKNWHHTWAGNSAFYPDIDTAYFLPMLRTPDDQWGHETFFRNTAKFAIAPDAATSTLYFKFKLPEARSQNVTLGIAADIDTKKSNQRDDVCVAALVITPQDIAAFSADREKGAAWQGLDADVKPGEWNGVWFVIHNQTGRYDVYLDAGAQSATAPKKVASDLAMRVAGRALDCFFVATHGKGAVFVADLFFDAEKENLKQPHPAGRR